MLRILEICDGGRVVVDASELFRVVVCPENEIADELVTSDEAAAFIDQYNACFPGRTRWAEIRRYSRLNG